MPWQQEEKVTYILTKAKNEYVIFIFSVRAKDRKPVGNC